jgi:transcription elongation GreA/GreB family factor
MALQQQAEKYKRQLQIAERQTQLAQEESMRLARMVAELKDRLANAGVGDEASSDTDVDETTDGITTEPWMTVTDPDTGDVFLWNEITGEIQSDLS